MKRRLRIDRVIVLFRAEQLFVISDRKKRCRKKDRTVSFIQTFLQIFRRIHTVKFNKKSSIPVIIRIDHIVFIHPVIDI